MQTRMGVGERMAHAPMAREPMGHVPMGHAPMPSGLTACARQANWRWALRKAQQQPLASQIAPPWLAIAVEQRLALDEGLKSRLRERERD